jgi:diacylglycerol kinase (ATP)
MASASAAEVPARPFPSPVPSSGRWTVVLNPTAGRGRAGRRWPALARALTAAGLEFEVLATARAGDATELVRGALARGADAFLAVGGDGTIHEVANGLLAGARPARLAAAPFGTGNDWARGLSLPSRPEDIAVLLATGRTRPLDAGRVEFVDGERRGERHFINVAGAGFDAYVVEHLPAGAPLAYLAGVVRGLWRYRPPSFEVRARAAPGRPAEVLARAALFATFVAIGDRCGGGMRFAPSADPGDGLLDVVAIPHLGPFAALARLPRVYLGTLERDADVRFARAIDVLLDAEPAARVEADGQLLGHTPARITVLPGALQVVVPPEGGA